MKKLALQFAALFLVIAAIFLVSGRSEGWVEPAQDEATGDIVLSGSKYNGKVAVTMTLHPDGTGEHEGNGEKVPATWEAGTDGVAYVVHFNVKDTDYDMNVIDDGAQYVADYPLVADFQLTGAKSGAAPAAADAAEAAEDADPETEDGEKAGENPETEAESGEEAGENSTSAESAAEDEGESYAPHTFVLPFTADVSDQLQTTFYVDPSVWGGALGATGEYTPTDSEDLLFSWSSAGQSNELDFFANGTYEYRFTKMNVTEHGTWTFEGWKITLKSEGGNEMTAEMTE